MVFKPIEQKFFTYEAEIAEGTLQDIVTRLNMINSNSKVQLVFVSNIVKISDDKFGAIIQTKKFK